MWLKPFACQTCLERPNTNISLARKTLISGALVTVGRRGSQRAPQTVAFALLFSLTHSAVQNRKSVKSEGGSDRSAGCTALGSPCPRRRQLSWDLLPLLGKETILVVRVVRLWICASAILVSPPDPAAEVGGIYI